MSLLDRFRYRPQPLAPSPQEPAPRASVPPPPLTAPALGGFAAVAEMPLGDLSFAVIDFETTGLSPDHDRVVEAACVRINADGSVVSEMHTLVDPGGPVGPTSIHGISQSDVRGAPSFAEIADALVSQLDGAVIVAHNASFDTNFLLAELARAGIATPPLPYVCTMRLRRLVKLPGPSAHKLTWACWQEGIPIESAHAAACDARAAGGLLARYLDYAKGCEMATLADCNGRGKAANSWKQPLPRLAGRGTQARLRQRSGLAGCPQHLIDGQDGAAEDVATYSAGLAAAAADFQIDEGEIEWLRTLVSIGRINPQQVRDAHDAHLRAQLDVRLKDGILTWAEEQEVRSFGRLLGVADLRVQELLSEAGATATIEGKPALAAADSAGAGIHVCFTGAFEAMPLTRSEVSELAEQAGMSVAKSVSKKVELVVCLDPGSGSSKLRRASELGTPIIDQQTFLALAGVQPDDQGKGRAVLEQIEHR